MPDYAQAAIKPTVSDGIIYLNLSWPLVWLRSSILATLRIQCYIISDESYFNSYTIRFNSIPLRSANRFSCSVVPRWLVLGLR